jgi:hypothetical protein
VPAAAELATNMINWFNGLSVPSRMSLGLLPAIPLQRPHFHSNRRVTSDGTVRYGLVVQLIQVEELDISGIQRKFPSGVTLVIDVTGDVRFVVRSAPYQMRTADLEAMATTARTNALGWSVEDPRADPFAVDYHGMHEART